ncbi:MAG: deoxyribose-phosphate aldolase [Geminicoccaceae bacterium]
MRLDLEEILAAADARSLDPTLARRLIGLVDLTSLAGDETPDAITALAREAVDHGVAALCILPAALPTAVPVLAGSPVRLATVANFPHGGDDLARAADEVAAGVALGADEVDVVAPLEAALSGDVGLVGELVEICRDAAGPKTTLKLILETGRLERPELITAVARSAVMAGVDFLKTSTGKTAVGATPEAVALLLAVAEEAGGRVGVKVSGGVRTAEDALRNWHLAETMMGADWPGPAHFRLGASRLLADLARRAGP